MKCILILMAWLHKTGEMPKHQADCFKGECAWWDEPTKRCLWHNVSEKLSFIYLELNEIRNKMPHEGQFRK